MPRTADHDARRAQLTDAVRDLLARDGFEAVTVAGVARCAGVSVGLVQHYFDSKDALLISAHRATLDAVDTRVARLVEAGEAEGESIRHLVLAALCEYLPLDHRRRTDQAVRLALLVRSATGRRSRALAADHSAGLRDRLAHVVANGKLCGEVDAGVDESSAAAELVALVGGLADELYVRDDAEPGSVERARLLLDAAVSRTFAHPCQRRPDGEPSFVRPSF